MQPKVELNKIRSGGEILDDSILFIKQNWRPLVKSYFTICGLFWITGLIVSTFNQIHSIDLLEQGESQFGWLYFTALFIEMINHTLILILTLSFIVLYKEKGNEPPTVEEVWVYVKYHFIRIFSTNLLLVIMTLIGLAFCFVPGIYFAPISSLTLTIMIIENAPLGYSFNRAFRLIKTKWWHVFGVLTLSLILIIVTMLLVFIPAAIIAFIVNFLIGIYGRQSYLVAVNIAAHLAQVLYLLPYVAIGLIYYSLVEQKEDTNLLHRIEMLGKADDITPDEPLHEEEY